MIKQMINEYVQMNDNEFKRGGATYSTVGDEAPAFFFMDRFMALPQTSSTQNNKHFHNTI